MDAAGWNHREATTELVWTATRLATAAELELSTVCADATNLTGLFGVGGGFVIVPALALVLGFPMGAAIGTSLLVIAVNTAVALYTGGRALAAIY